MIRASLQSYVQDEKHYGNSAGHHHNTVLYATLILDAVQEKWQQWQFFRCAQYPDVDPVMGITTIFPVIIAIVMTFFFITIIELISLVQVDFGAICLEMKWFGAWSLWLSQAHHEHHPQDHVSTDVAARMTS